MGTTQYIRYPSTSGSGGTGVTSLNALTGALTLAAGTGITITPSGSTLTIAATGSGSGVSSVTASTPLFSSGGTSPNLTIQQSSASQSGYLSSTDWSTFNAKQPAGSYLTALTGDGTAAGPGSATLTLATVNANTGAFGSTTSVATFTVNGKGLLTAAGATSIQIAESQVTNLVSDLAGKQATGNYLTALTGDVTATGPGSVASHLVATTNSTLTTLSALSLPGSQVTGNISGNAANVTGTVAVANGGTGLTTLTTGNVLLGAGTSSPTFVAPGTSGNVLTSNGTTWTSSAAGAGISAGPTTIQNAAFSTSVSGGAITFTLTTLSGAAPSSGSPVSFVFRGISSAVPLVGSTTSTITLTLQGTSTLGINDLSYHDIYLYAIYSVAGGLELGVSRVPFDEGALQNTQTEAGGGGTTNANICSTTGRSPAVIRYLGRLQVSNSANTWATPLDTTTVPFFTGPVVAQYSTSSTQAIPNLTETTINYDTVNIDTAGCVTTGSSWQFATPGPGFYKVDAKVNFINGTSAVASYVISIFMNASEYSRYEIDVAYGSMQGLQISDIVESTSIGDTIHIGVFQGTGNPCALNGVPTANTISIYQLSPILR